MPEKKRPTVALVNRYNGKSATGYRMQEADAETAVRSAKSLIDAGRIEEQVARTLALAAEKKQKERLRKLFDKAGHKE